jgi:hypothetical protein
MSRPARDGAARSRSPVAVLSLLLLAVIVLVRVVLPALEDQRFGVATTARGGGWSSDFVGILTYVRALWAGEASYDVASHLRVTSERVGRPVDYALPFGYPPTILWLLGPFCLLPDAWSFAAWSIASLLAVAWILRRGPSPWIAAACLSPLVFACFSLGQTALLTTAAVLFLAGRDLAGEGEARGATFPAACSVVLWTLSAKPPLAVTAGVALLLARRWRTVAAASAFTVGSLLLLLPVIGLGWTRDYLRIITHYDLQTANSAFTNAIAPQTMNNLRALLHVTFGAGDAIASRVSAILWMSSLAAAGALAWRAILTPGGCWIGVIFGYLLFFPHLTYTEDLLLLAVLALLPELETGRRRRLLAIALSLAVLYLAAGLVLAAPVRAAVVFGLKLSLAIACLGASFVASPPAMVDPRIRLREYRGKAA